LRKWRRRPRRTLWQELGRSATGAVMSRISDEALANWVRAIFQPIQPTAKDLRALRNDLELLPFMKSAGRTKLLWDRKPETRRARRCRRPDPNAREFVRFSDCARQLQNLVLRNNVDTLAGVESGCFQYCGDPPTSHLISAVHQLTTF
jgi:hypothetical protein